MFRAMHSNPEAILAHGIDAPYFFVERNGKLDPSQSVTTDVSTHQRGASSHSVFLSTSTSQSFVDHWPTLTYGHSGDLSMNVFVIVTADRQGLHLETHEVCIPIKAYPNQIVGYYPIIRNSDKSFTVRHDLFVRNGFYDPTIFGDINQTQFASEAPGLNLETSVILSNSHRAEVDTNFEIFHFSDGKEKISVFNQSDADSLSGDVLIVEDIAKITGIFSWSSPQAFIKVQSKILQKWVEDKQLTSLSEELVYKKFDRDLSIGWVTSLGQNHRFSFKMIHRETDYIYLLLQDEIYKTQGEYYEYMSERRSRFADEIDWKNISPQALKATKPVLEAKYQKMIEDAARAENEANQQIFSILHTCDRNSKFRFRMDTKGKIKDLISDGRELPLKVAEFGNPAFSLQIGYYLCKKEYFTLDYGYTNSFSLLLEKGQIRHNGKLIKLIHVGHGDEFIFEVVPE